MTFPQRWLRLVPLVATAAVLCVWNAASARPAWFVVGSTLVFAAWVATTLLLRSGRPTASLAVAFPALALGSFLAAPGGGMLLVPVTVLLLLLVSREEVPLTAGLIAAGIAVVGLAVGLIVFRPDVGIGGLAAMALAIALGAVGGIARRRDALSRRALEAAREDSIAAREAEVRIRIARELHDVLAHSMSGLILQLDAASALLEADRPAEAQARVAGAATLAREGMDDARAAVATLRAPAVPAASAPVDPSARIADLIATHRALGAEVVTTVTGTPRVIDGACAGAITRAVQEGLSNARRHAPGATAQLGLDWTGSAVRLRVATALPEGRQAGVSPGPRSAPSPERGGLGLVGMKERFAALPRGGTASAGPVGREFVITAEARL